MKRTDPRRGLFAGIAGGGRAGCAGAGGGLEFAASASDPESGDQFFQVFFAASCAGDAFFSSDGNERFKLRSAFFAQEFIDRHSEQIIAETVDYG